MGKKRKKNPGPPNERRNTVLRKREGEVTIPALGRNLRRGTGGHLV